MFAAKFTGICTACNAEFPAGASIRKNMTGIGYRHEVCGAAVRKAAETNALEDAVVAREVAEDEYAANEYWWTTINVDRELGFGARFWRAHDKRETLRRAMDEARFAALVEADAVGIIDLQMPEGESDEDTIARLKAVMAFSALNPPLARPPAERRPGASLCP